MLFQKLELPQEQKVYLKKHPGMSNNSHQVNQTSISRRSNAFLKYSKIFFRKPDSLKKMIKRKWHRSFEFGQKEAKLHHHGICRFYD